MCHMAIANCYQWMGRFSEAVGYYRRMQPMFEAVPRFLGLARHRHALRSDADDAGISAICLAARIDVRKG